MNGRSIPFIVCLVVLSVMAPAFAGTLVFPQPDTQTACIYRGAANTNCGAGALLYGGGFFQASDGSIAYGGGPWYYPYCSTGWSYLRFLPEATTVQVTMVGVDTCFSTRSAPFYLEVRVQDTIDDVVMDKTIRYSLPDVLNNSVTIAVSGVAISNLSAHVVDWKFSDCPDATNWVITSVSATQPLYPSVTVTPQRNGDGTYAAVVTYSFPGTSPGTLSLSVLPTGDEPGMSYSPPTLDMSGTWVQQLGSFDTDRTLQAVASACDGTKTAEATITCSDCKGPTKSVGGPVRLFDGVMTYTETDPLPVTIGSELRREYSSGARADGRFGLGWASVFDASAIATDATGLGVAVVSEDRSRAVFRMRGDGVWGQTFPAGGVAATLTGSEATGYTFRDAAGTLVRTFGTNHRLIRLQDLRRNRAVSISYDTSGNPTRIFDEAGNWSATVTTASNHVTQIAVDGRPDLTWTYTYAGSLLTSVTVAGAPAPWRAYQYSGNRLSAIIDATGSVLESHDYDAAGRAISSHDASGDITNISFPASDANGIATTTVTRADNSQATYQQAFAGGSVVTQKVDGGCSSCGTNDATAAYDSYGNLTRLQNARGYITESTYDVIGRHLITTRTALAPSNCNPNSDPGHCRLTSDVLAYTNLTSTAATQTTTYTYGDPNWSSQPTQIARDSVLRSGATTSETFTFDPATGDPLVHSATGYVDANGTSETHTTTTLLYNGTEGAAFDPGGAFQSLWLSLAQPGGLKKSTDGPRTDVADVTSFVYYPYDSSVPAPWRGRLAATRNAAGHTTRFSDYDVFGHALTVTDANGVVTRSTFDALGRLLTSTVAGVPGCDTAADPLCATDVTATRAYASVTGPLVSEQRPNGGVTSWTYDTRGRVLTITRGTATTGLERTTYTYDPTTGKKASETLSAYQNGAWATTKTETFAYTSDGSLSSVTHADNTALHYSYLPDGTLAGTQDENHSTPNTTYAYDAANHLTTVTQTLASAAGGQIVTRYGYDVAGNLTGVTDPNGNVTSYVYDDFRRMQQQTSPVSGTTTYSYDAAGNLLSTTDANGATTTRTYDALNRVTASSSTLSGSTEAILWTYDDATAGRFGIGRMASMSDPTGSTTYQYERRGMLRNEAKTISGATYTTSYTYDADGNRATMTYPSGLVARYGFDFADRPYSLTAGTTSIVSAATYLPFGPLTTLTLGNGTTRTMQYDNRYRPLENKLTGPAGTIADYGYAEDHAGNITQIHDLTDARYNRDFGYDDLNRLTTANGGSQLWGSGSYTYDAMGNMTASMLGTWQTTSSTLAGATSKLASVVENGVTKPVFYDAAGNERSAGTSAYVWSPRNQLVSADVASYAYDGRGVMTIGVVALLAAGVAPSSVTGGLSATGTITLSIPSGSDTVVTLSSSNSAAAVPQSITVAAGATSASFPVTSIPVATDTPVTITASFGQSTATAVLHVVPAQLSAISFSPSSLPGGTSSTGTVTLTGITVTSAAISLSSAPFQASVPSSVTVPSGSSAVQFPLSSTPVASDTQVTITATSGPVTRQAAVMLHPADLASITASPSAIHNLQTCTGTVTLDATAVSSTTIQLSQSYPTYSSVTFPSSINIPAGSSSATFSITATSAATAYTATIVATHGSVTRQTTLTVLPPTLTAFSVSPTSLVGGVAPATANATFDSSANTTMTVPIDSTNTNVVPRQPITLPAGATSTSAPVLSTPVSTSTSVVLSTTDSGGTKSSVITLQPPSIRLSGLTLSATSIVGGNKLTGTVMLSAPAPAGGTDVDLYSSDPTWVYVPPYVRVSAGSTSQTFTVLAKIGSGSAAWVSVTGALTGTSASAQLTVVPPASPYVTKVEVYGSWDANGNFYGYNGYIHLNAAVAKNTAIALVSSDPAALSVPKSTTARAGYDTASFSVTVSTVTSAKGVTATASLNGSSQTSAPLYLAPPNGVTFNQIVVWGPNYQQGIVASGTTAPGAVVLSGPAPAGGLTISIAAGPRPNVCAVAGSLSGSSTSITVPAGRSQGDFSITNLPFLGRDRGTTLTLTMGSASISYDVALLAAQPQVQSRMSDVVRCASLSLAPCLTAAGLHAAATLASGDPARYYLYTPELRLMAETEQSTSATKAIAYSYLWFGGQPVAQMDATTNTTRWYAVDHLGTPFLQTDATANVVWRAEYTPYGDIFAYRAGSTFHQPLRLPGQSTTDGSSLYNNIYRWYGAGWGRYTQADPAGVAFSDVNVYSYAGDDPVRYLDPTGLVKVTQTFTKRGTDWIGGGQYSLAFNKVQTSGKCVGCKGKWQIELSLTYDHGYFCSLPGTCDIELRHANIASAYVAKAAEEYKKYEEQKYQQKDLCEAMAAVYAQGLHDYMSNPDSWPTSLKKSYWHAQQDYEDTHHEGLCGWLPPSWCSAY